MLHPGNKQAIKFWANEDKPREKLLQQGAKALSNTELLAILINNGTATKSAIDLAREVLQTCDHSLPELGTRSIKHLSAVKGIGQVKAIKILAALELGNRRNQDFSNLKKNDFTNSKFVYEYLKPDIIDAKTESFGVLYLNNSNKIQAKKIISEGGLTATVVDIRLILKYAFEYDAVAIIVYHNHPSGKLEASDEDKQMTQKIKTACTQCAIRLLDHLILTTNNYFSFADNDIL